MMALLVLVALVGGFLVGRSWGERFPRAAEAQRALLEAEAAAS